VKISCRQFFYFVKLFFVVEKYLHISIFRLTFELVSYKNEKKEKCKQKLTPNRTLELNSSFKVELLH